MSARRGPVANVLDFKTQFQKAISVYEEKVLLRLRELQRTMDPVLGSHAVDAELEAHIRGYVIDPLLAALNWATDENLTIEALVRSQETGNRRRLDYLGTESETVRPLLVVEAKRPNAPKPEPVRQRNFVYTVLLAEALSELKQDRHKPLDLQGSWGEWMHTLFDYVTSLQGAIPVRVAMTNGDWLIVFEDPANAFQGTDSVSADAISFYGSRADILKNAAQVFASLNYDSMVPLGRAVEVGEVLGLIRPVDVTQSMRAVRVTYSDTQTGLGVVPTMHLVPELVLFRSDGGWFRVYANTAIQLPHDPRALADHLAQMAAEHANLYNSVVAILGRAPPLLTLEDSYRAEWLGHKVPPVQPLDRQTHLVVLGQHTHFVVPDDTHLRCPFHRAAGAIVANASLDVIIPKPSSVHVTHFGDQSVHHCAHRTMRQLREQQVAEHNRQNFLPRGPAEDGPFCKLWGFEHYLCCQTCAFREVCTYSIGRLMPCCKEP